MYDNYEEDKSQSLLIIGECLELQILQMSAEAGELRIKPVRVTDQAGSDWMNDLYDLFAPVRSQATKHSEEDVNTAIDKAVQAVRKAHG